MATYLHVFHRNVFTLLSLCISLFMLACSEVKGPVAVGPIPSERQMNWQEMEYYAFIHFGINTFTDVEWGYGDKSPSLFNPSDLDCRQWAKVCKDAGMKGIILTAKHHDGFCLWPSEYTEYSVKQSPWRGGKGDLVRELSDACKEYGLKLGIYLSPWDRNHPDYGKPEYITYFRNQLRELLSDYGDIFEVWFDGANGGSGYYGGANEERRIDRRTYYDWPHTFELVRELQPNAVIFSDGGPDVRWCGNEEGWVSETNWSLLRRDEVWPGYPNYKELRTGHPDGTHWVPAEVNVSMRPGWFYHAYEDDRVKTLPELLNIYYYSFGRNGTLLINFPIDKRGLIHEIDARRIVELAEAVKADFKINLIQSATVTASNVRGNSDTYAAANVIDSTKDTYWATDDKVTKASLDITWSEPVEFNRFLVQEYIRLGQRVESFTLEAYVEDTWKEIASETTIGYKRILRFPTVLTTQVRFTINDVKGPPLISTIGFYNAPRLLTAPVVRRDKEGRVSMQAADPDADIYYTVDGTTPTLQSQKYTSDFPVEGKILIRAITANSLTGEVSPETHEQFDISRKNWKIDGDAEMENVIDGNPLTHWHQVGATMPLDLVIDLGTMYTIEGFRYLPEQSYPASGIIFNYQFYTSADNQQWKLASEGEFSNIKNNPLWQTRKFPAARARFVKFRAINNTENDAVAGYAEFDILTK
ncbi:MAG: alpha-L-fucosidase [Tannerellaceae bacterium]|nr:alpha-L-fucosidase [Tannerellaceae bacterium]